MHLVDKLPVDLFVEGSNLSNPQLSPKGNFISYLVNSDNGTDLVIYSLISKIHRKLLVNHKISTGTAYGGETYSWMNNENGIIYSSNGTLYKIEITGGNPVKLISIDKSFHPKVDSQGLYFIIEHEKRMSLASAKLKDTDFSWPDQMPLKHHFIYDPDRHPDGSFVVHVWDYPNMSWDGSSIVKLSPSGEKKIIAGGSYSVAQPRFNPDYTLLAFISEETGWRNIWIANSDGDNKRILVDEEAEHAYSTWISGERDFIWIDSRRIVGVQNKNGFFRLFIVDIDGNRQFLDLPEGYYQKLTSDGNGKLAYLFSNHNTKERLELLNISDDNSIISHQVIAESGVILDKFKTRLRKPEHIEFPTRDGEKAHGLLYKPNNSDPSTPLLILVHGGPTGMFYDKFRFDPQFFSDKGWMVLGINHRGSIGYGLNFRQILMGKWGDYDVNDSIDAISYLADKNLIDPKKVAIMGGSAGGFTTLMALAKYPGTFAAGVNLYGVSDMFLLAEETHYLEAHYTDQLVGPLPEAADNYYQRSPINFADQIKDPLLVLQGGKDPVVPPNQSELIHQKTSGYSEFKIYPEEGHGFKKTANLKDMYDRIERFLTKYVVYKND